MNISLLGQFRISIDDDEHVLPTAKARVLLAWLIMHANEPQARRSLAQRFWPDAETDRAMHNLRMALSFLRPLMRKNDSGVLDITAQTVSFTPNDTVKVDVLWLAHMSAQIAQHIHRHPQRCHVCMSQYAEIATNAGAIFLDGIELDDVSELADWVHEERERLRTVYFNACWMTAQWYVRVQRLADAIAMLQSYIAYNPWHEEAQCLFMECLMQAGERMRALLVAQQYEQRMAHDFASMPQLSTQQTIARIRQNTWTPPTRIPTVTVPRTPFFGREAELQLLQRMLSETRYQLISIIGPGGSGKTLLAYHVAHMSHTGFAQGAYFVALEHINDEHEMLYAIARAFHVQLNPGQSLLTQVIEALTHADALVVLDNCEQLVRFVSCVTQLLDACPRLVFLVTSRVPFQVSYEYRLMLSGLSYPPPHVTTIHESAAVQLFVARAQMHDSQRDWYQEHAHIVSICRMLDGLPLAIELAAGLSRSMSCARVVQLIRQRLDVLMTDTQDTPIRHRQLTVVFDEMWHKLSDTQRAVMRQLMVFQGGFDDAALQAVIAPTTEMTNDIVIDVALRQLHDLGLLRFQQMRYSIHPILRQYVLERMHIYDDVVADAHMCYYMRSMNHPALNYVRTDTMIVVEQLANDIDNIYVAWRHACMTQQHDLIASGARPLHVLAICTGRVPEVADLLRETAEVLLSHQETTGYVFVQLALWEGRLRHRLGDYQRMHEVALQAIIQSNGAYLAEEALATSLISIVESSMGQGEQALQRLNAVLPNIADDNHEVLADVYIRMGEALIFTQQDRSDDVNLFMERAFVAYRHIDDVAGVANCHIWLAYQWVFAGEPQKTIELLERTLDMVQRTGDRRVIGLLLGHVGNVHVFFGDKSPAHIAKIEAGLQHLRDISDWVCELEVLHLLIYAHIACEQFASAMRLLDSAQQRIIHHGNPIQQLLFTDVSAMLCMALGHSNTAAALLEFVVQHPSMHAVYRPSSMQVLAQLTAQFDAVACEAARQQCLRWQEMPLPVAMQHILTTVTKLIAKIS